jgi:hypothetical protein
MRICRVLGIFVPCERTQSRQHKVARELAAPIAAEGEGHTNRSASHLFAFLFGNAHLDMKTDRIRTDITDIVFVFIFMSGFGFEYG